MTAPALPPAEADRRVKATLACGLLERGEDRHLLAESGWDGGKHDQAYRFAYRARLIGLLRDAAGDFLRAAVVAFSPDDESPENAYSAAAGVPAPDLFGEIRRRSGWKKSVYRADVRGAVEELDAACESLSAAATDGVPGRPDPVADFMLAITGEGAGGAAATAETVMSGDWITRMIDGPVTDLRNRTVGLLNHRVAGDTGPPDGPEIPEEPEAWEQFQRDFYAAMADSFARFTAAVRAG